MKKTLLFLLSMALLLAFSSCGDDIEKLDSVNNSATQNSPVSPIRTGVYRQGILALENGFECTDGGSYFMCRVGTAYWLLYCDHGSDEIIKLCGRPDCSHSDSDCNAYFDSGVNICYYDGNLYTFSTNEGIIKFDIDGTSRMKILGADSLYSSTGYRGLSSPRIWNGVFTVSLKKLDEEGNEISQSFYYKLDGTMKALEKSQNLSALNNEGNAFVGIVGADTSTDPITYIFGEWNPEDNTKKEYFRDADMYAAGYIGTEAIYYVENGIIYEQRYSGELKALCDTGLTGNYRLICFPDCLVIDKALASQDILNGEKVSERTMYFYDWNFNSLGDLKIDFPFDPTMPGLICGETHERIMLTDSYNLIPKYYINKSDFGSGSIEIHKFKLPDFE